MPTFEEIPVIGQPGELDWYQYLYLEELQRQRERDATPPDPNSAPDNPALAPPVVPLEPAPLPLPTLPKVNPWVGAGSAVLRGVLWFLFPQPTGPREHDELDEFDIIGNRPPPNPPPPPATDPIMPPNWNDMVEWPGTPRYVPILPTNIGEPVEMPPGEKEFIVSPPRVTPAPKPEKPTIIIEDPLGDYGTDFGFGPAPSSPGAPRVDPVSPDLADDFEPTRSPQPDRPSSPAPDIFSPTLPDWFGDPIGDPYTPSPEPTAPRIPTGVPELPEFLSPTFTPDLVPQPILTQFRPDPFTTKDQCDCAKKKKKKKDRKDRQVCYRGTYVETKRGLVKKRLEEIPCETASSGRKRAAPSASSGTKRKKLKPGQFPGLSLLGSNMTGSDFLDLASHAVKEFAPIVADLLKKKKKKATKPKRNRKPKTRIGRDVGDIFSSPFYTGD